MCRDLDKGAQVICLASSETDDNWLWTGRERAPSFRYAPARSILNLSTTLTAIEVGVARRQWPPFSPSIDHLPSNPAKIDGTG